MPKTESDERLLLDTPLLILGAHSPEKLSRKTRKALDIDPSLLVFSVVSLWEITIKRPLKRVDFRFDPLILRSRLLQLGMTELEVTAAHVLSVARLPSLHRDPFDRLLISQASVERLVFLTSDKLLADYSNRVRFV